MSNPCQLIQACPAAAALKPDRDAGQSRGPARLVESPAPVLWVVEGIHDIQFLRRISRMLHAHDPALPDLAAWEAEGRLVFLPFGGGDVCEWTHRLAPLGLCELHLYDAERGVETLHRQRAAAAVAARPGCRAFVTGKRNLENYLTPAAIREARGITITFSDQDNVADLAARFCYEQEAEGPVWELLPPRARKRLRERVKHGLNTSAVEQMTLQRLRESDPQDEIIGWLRAAAELAQPA